jgi:hypothetical protein
MRKGPVEETGDGRAFSELVLLHEFEAQDAASKPAAPWTAELGLSEPPDDDGKRIRLLGLATGINRLDIVEQAAATDPSAAVRTAAASLLPLAVA